VQFSVICNSPPFRLGLVQHEKPASDVIDARVQRPHCVHGSNAIPNLGPVVVHASIINFVGIKNRNLVGIGPVAQLRHGQVSVMIRATGAPTKVPNVAPAVKLRVEILLVHSLIDKVDLFGPQRIHAPIHPCIEEHIFFMVGNPHVFKRVVAERLERFYNNANARIGGSIRVKIQSSLSRFISVHNQVVCAHVGQHVVDPGSVHAGIELGLELVPAS